MVLRLRVNKDVPLAEAIDEALAKAGIASLAMTAPMGALDLSLAYKKTPKPNMAQWKKGALRTRPCSMQRWPPLRPFFSKPRSNGSKEF